MPGPRYSGGWLRGGGGEQTKSKKPDCCLALRLGALRQETRFVGPPILHEGSRREKACPVVEDQTLRRSKTTAFATKTARLRSATAPKIAGRAMSVHRSVTNADR